MPLNPFIRGLGLRVKGWMKISSLFHNQDNKETDVVEPEGGSVHVAVGWTYEPRGIEPIRALVPVGNAIRDASEARASWGPHISRVPERTPYRRPPFRPRRPWRRCGSIHPVMCLFSVSIWYLKWRSSKLAYHHILKMNLIAPIWIRSPSLTKQASPLGIWIPLTIVELVVEWLIIRLMPAWNWMVACLADTVGSLKPLLLLCFTANLTSPKLSTHLAYDVTVEVATFRLRPVFVRVPPKRIFNFGYQSLPNDPPCRNRTKPKYSPSLPVIFPKPHVIVFQSTQMMVSFRPCGCFLSCSGLH